MLCWPIRPSISQPPEMPMPSWRGERTDPSAARQPMPKGRNPPEANTQNEGRRVLARENAINEARERLGESPHNQRVRRGLEE